MNEKEILEQGLVPVALAELEKRLAAVRKDHGKNLLQLDALQVKLAASERTISYLEITVKWLKAQLAQPDGSEEAKS